MHQNICYCDLCKDGAIIDKLGMQLAEEEILPFIKKNLLKMQYINHPLPLRYSNSLSSIFAYCQAIAFDRAHKNMGRKYFTTDSFLLKFKDQLNEKFIRIIICDEAECKNEIVQKVCQFNVEK